MQKKVNLEVARELANALQTVISRDGDIESAMVVNEALRIVLVHGEHSAQTTGDALIEAGNNLAIREEPYGFGNNPTG